MNIYLLALIVGGGLLLISVLGGQGDFGADADIGDGAGDADLSEGIAPWFSLRSATSFVAFFGLAGTLAQLAHLSSVETLITALASGLAAGALTAYAFKLARQRGEVGFEAAALTGRVGRVLLPVGPGKLGRVQLEIGGQLEQMTARSEQTLPLGSQVIVTGHEDGVLEVQSWGEGEL